MSASEVTRLFQAMTSVKFRAVLMTAYAAGLRVSEVTALKIRDIDSQRMVIWVRKGKGHRDRFVALSPVLLQFLREYWKQEQPREWLFPAKGSQKPLDADSVQRACRKARVAAGIKKLVTPHTLRHTFATHQWISCPRGFFLPVRVLSRYFRRRFLEELSRLVSRPAFVLRGEWERLRDPEEWSRLLRKLREKNWVVYAKPPFGGPEQVLKYLSRYTHKVAISNRRLISLQNDVVALEWKDYAHGNRWRTMTLPAVEFLRRFLQHVLPEGFHRIRHYGFLSNRDRREALNRCRELLGVPTSPSVQSTENTPSSNTAAKEDELLPLCPVCRKGHMIRIGAVHPATPENPAPIAWDTS